MKTYRNFETKTLKIEEISFRDKRNAKNKKNKVEITRSKYVISWRMINL